MSSSRASILWESSGGELLHRLRAWWYGFDLRTLVPSTRDSSDQVVEVVETGPLDRLVLAQRIWGTGFLVPGGPDHIMSLVKPFGVNPAMSLLDLTAGLGGPSRQISSTFDVYITGLERSAVVAQRGHNMSVDAGLGRKVPITAYDPESVELRPHTYDGVYAQHLTASITDKERLLREVMRSLKPRGQFSFIDFVLRDGEANDPRLDKLRKVEPFPFQPWRVQQYLDCLTAAGFDCRIAEDQTELFRTQVAHGWENMLTQFDLKSMPKHHLPVLLDEAELWMTRLAAIESKMLCVYRFYAVSTYGSVM
jgi:SAM-dependent methyltransferase